MRDFLENLAVSQTPVFVTMVGGRTLGTLHQIIVKIFDSGMLIEGNGVQRLVPYSALEHVEIKRYTSAAASDAPRP